jgi:hypothetical protein
MKKIFALTLMLLFLQGNLSAQDFTAIVKSTGCKIVKGNSDEPIKSAEFIQWKKDEFRMVSQTLVAASIGVRIWFEEEIYESNADAENRLKNFKKLPPKMQETYDKFHGKMLSEFSFREAFRKGNKVYIVSAPASFTWSNGDVTKYRKKLEKQLKETSKNT